MKSYGQYDRVRDGSVGPPALATYRAEQRWKLRDKCLRVATYYRVMHLRAHALRAASLARMQRRFAAWAPSFVEHCRLRKRREGHDVHSARERVSRQGLVSASTRMQLMAPDIYRESRRNAPRRVRQRSAGRRRLLPTLVEAEIGSRLYSNMCTIASRFMEWLARDTG